METLSVQCTSLSHVYDVHFSFPNALIFYYIVFGNKQAILDAHMESALNMQVNKKRMTRGKS